MEENKIILMLWLQIFISLLKIKYNWSCVRKKYWYKIKIKSFKLLNSHKIGEKKGLLSRWCRVPYPFSLCCHPWQNGATPTYKATACTSKLGVEVKEKNVTSPMEPRRLFRSNCRRQLVFEYWAEKRCCSIFSFIL
jgi:hypothetical protein